ncbi:TPA: hypothetical protein HA318_03350 [Candidatus Micrarchaeota archaeon]|nr:MAG: hypothetical protein AUJ65_01340 [Candidatus Micrarchaeota archaeon CG1_02_51_15]HII39012.1 hypothetical protein [Candidatus Micrarchaeota archaeon]
MPLKKRVVDEGVSSDLYDRMKADKKRPEDEAPKVDFFIRYTAWAAKAFRGFGRGAKYTDEQAEVMEFVGYRVTAEDFRAAEMGALIIGLVVWMFIALAAYFAVGVFMLSPPSLDPEMVFQNIFFIAGAAMGLIVPLAMFMLYQTRPSSMANREKMLAIGYMPEIINYLIMSMRLSPNLEKAVEFAANHGRGKIADDFKKIVWDVQIGKYLSIEEALDELAYRWGKYNDDFKQALMMVRASVLEADQARREALLEKAVEGVLEGSKEKMDLFARQLHAPTVYLYYFGVLLPLMLAIVLPIGSSLMKGMPFGRPDVLFLLYAVGLPIGIYGLGSMILGGRPPTYEAPEIPEDFPGLPPKGKMQVGSMLLPYVPLALLIGLGIVFGGYFLDQMITIHGITLDLTAIGFDEIQMEGIAEYNWSQEIPKLPQITLPFLPQPWNYFGMVSIFGFLIGTALMGSVYLYGKYSARKKIQDEIRSMENEFKDVTYVLASRLGENRPIEDAMKHAVEFLPKSKLSNRVFRRILDNISTLGMTLDEAVFNPTFGAVKDLPSKTIHSGMSILIDSVGLGVNVAAKSLIGLSMQLRNAEKIDLMLRRLLEDVTSMLRTMGTFIAPIVLGVVTSLQGVIVGAIAGQECPEKIDSGATGGGMGGFLSGASNMGNLFCSEKGVVKTDPIQFTFIMGIYVIEVVALLTYFNAQVEDSGNKLHTYMSIAKALPIATVLFCLVAYFAGSTLATAGGG